MQAKPGAPPRGYCYRAGSKHAAHGKVTKGIGSIRTNGWMDGKEVERDFKIIHWSIFYKFFSVDILRLSLMCLCLLTGEDACQEKQNPGGFECRIRNGISHRQLYYLSSKLCQAKALPQSMWQSFRDRFGLVAQFNVSRRHAKNLSVTSRDGVSTSPTISICLLFKRELLKTVQVCCQNRFLDSFSRDAAANLRRHIWAFHIFVTFI